MKTEKSSIKKKLPFRISAKRCLSLTLVLMLLSGLFNAAAAYDACGTISSIVLPNKGRNVTYYDIYGGMLKGRPDTSDETRFYMDVVGEQDNLLKWANLAYDIFSSDGKTYWDHAGGGWDKDFGTGHYIDFIKDMIQPRQDRNSNGMKSTGLSIANSLKDVQTRAADDIAWLIARKLKADDFMGQHKIDKLTDSNQPVVYSTVSMIDRYGSSPQYGYNSFTIAFYNFQLHVLDDGGALNTVTGDDSLKEATGKDTPGFSYSSGPVDSGLISVSENKSLEESTTTLNLQESTSSTVSSTIGGSENYSFEENIGFNVSLGAKIPLVAEGGLSFSGGVTFNQAIGTSYSNEKSVNNTETKSSSVTMSVPAHTIAGVNQTKTITNMTTAYDCPIGVSYDVAIFSMNGTVYDDNSHIKSFSTAGYDQRSFITIFGNDADCSDAVENLYQRASKNKSNPSYEQTYGYTKGTSRSGEWTNKLNWNTILSRDLPKCNEKSYSGKLKKSNDMIDAIAGYYPMSVTGASTSITETALNSELTEPVPMYPIKYITIAYQLNRDFDMKIGDSLPIYSYRVNAFDEEMVPYHGFVPSAGEWKIVDSNGNPAESSVAKMTLDQITHQQCVLATGEGTTYVKYFIKEGDYVDYSGRVSKNEDISSPAYKIVVTGEEASEFTGRIDLAGEVEAVVNGDPVNLNAIDTLSVAAYDSTDKQVDINVNWEAQELEKNGISVTPDGVLTVTQPGTFHVRAYYDNVYSSWIPVNAVNEKSLIISQSDPVPASENPAEPVQKEFDSKTMITRGEFIQFLHSMCGLPISMDGFSFDDVDKDALYSFALSWAKSMGFVNGISENTFKPDQGLTRQQMATIVFKVAKAMGYPVDLIEEDIKNVLISYSDSDQIPAWAQQAMAYAVQNGFIKPDENGKLNGGDYVDRSDAADVIIDISEMIPSQSANEPEENTDNTGDTENTDADDSSADSGVSGDPDSSDDTDNTEPEDGQAEA